MMMTIKEDTKKVEAFLFVGLMNRVPPVVLEAYGSDLCFYDTDADGPCPPKVTRASLGSTWHLHLGIGSTFLRSCFPCLLMAGLAGLTGDQR